MADPEKRAIKPRQKSSLPIILVLVVLAALMGLLLWKFALAPREPAVSFQPPVATPPATAPPTATLHPEEGRPDLAAPPSQDQITLEPVPPVDECALVSQQLTDFFQELDQRDYIQARQEADGTQVILGRLIDRLLANPPVVSGETDSLFAILNNTAHFYRVLQRKDLLLIKDILDHEGTELEKIMALFYRWSQIAHDCPPTGLGIHLPLPATYEYAGFFLNTLGGRSYLFRRESRVRSLVKYYSALTLDRANDAGLNRHGLDIRPTINGLLAEMLPQQALRMRDEYLATLNELQDKYQRQYGH
ncbi:hypothetical protein ACHHRT_08735 [Desulfurivibrio sp. D14AmB]|uniref:hypothetical protein n=1 Tax=Desulfurivibrio sp. D14AmB TaxID=3374370 RepID=UPI00376EC9AC